MRTNLFMVLFSILICSNIFGQDLNEIENIHLNFSFKPGNYFLIEDNVKVYSNPDIDSQVLLTLAMHDEISLLEDVHNTQTFDGVRSCWYRIKYNQITGYIWGGGIAVKTVLYDIDKNGIVDYFQYRIANSESRNYLRIDKDIVIYINKRRICFESLIENPSIDYWYTDCDFEEENNSVNIFLSFFEKHNSIIDVVLQITMDGEIVFKDRKQSTLEVINLNPYAERSDTE
ncbi:SH3 domain-containing protein [Breznakiella homolactica]|uniref:SH3 domain-containing protein n=1 Tax=Breznakiella homolactica TaxID=2798577 RepID=A0A7T7XPA4_9SPIR|nr:SH3 domain-containing protein [Breznakiella homolactica]QQO09991.1 SH3 domain-containing protein [Breznakiella homolactica]